MKSLKIALLTYSTKPRGGVVHTINLAEELVSLGHQVHVFALTSGEGFFRQVNAPYTLIPYENNPGESIDEKVEKYINTYYTFLSGFHQSYEIYHAEDCISANALLQLRNEGVVKSFIRTVHHVDDFTSPSLIECQLKSILEPDHVIVVSKLWERELKSRYSLSPTVINNGVDVEKFRMLENKGEKERAKEGFSVSGCRTVLSVGGIEPRKNTLTSLKAFSIARSRLRDKGERLVWLIAGGETLFDYREYRAEFFRVLEDNGIKLGEDIRLLGNVSHDSMPRLYGATDVFLFPSVKEGWGLVALEAMACGLPVIASDIEPLTEYLHDGENAMLIPPMDYDALADGIIAILEKPGEYRKVIENGRKTAEAYSWRNTALKHEEFYDKALKTGR